MRSTLFGTVAGHHLCTIGIPMLYNIGIPMVHKWCPTVAWYAQLITVAMNERWNFVCGILCFLKD